MSEVNTEPIMSQSKLESLRGLKSSRPKYELIKDFLLSELTNGNYKPGDALPSENKLIKKLGVARNTVRQAVDELAKDGLVKRIQGKGSYFTNHGNNNGPEEQLQIFSLLLPQISHSLYPVLVKGFDHQAGESHLQVMLCNTDFDINKQGNIILQMIEKNVAGVAMVPALTPATPAFHIHQLQRNNIPVVLCHRPVAGASAPLITWEAKSVAQLAGKTLLEHGHRRIAFFAHSRYSLTETYEECLRQILQDFDADLPADNVHYGSSPTDMDSEMKAAAEVLRVMMRGSEPVTAIFCNDDEEAELLYYVLLELGIRVPEDVSLMGFGDYHSRDGVFLRRLTSVTIDEYEVGIRAAKVLFEMRAGQRPIDSEEVIYKPLVLSEGDTVATIQR